MPSGETCKAEKIEHEQKFTQPPPRYTEATLVKALEEKGIGRPSTYSPTISTIVERGYIAREKKQLVPTELGFVVNRFMMDNFDEIVDVQFTASMENDLDGVEEDKVGWADVLGKFYGPFHEKVEIALEKAPPEKIPDEVSDIVCEKCGAMMVYKIGRFGKFLACPNFHLPQHQGDCRKDRRALPQVRRVAHQEKEQARQGVLRLRKISGVRLCLLGQAHQAGLPAVRRHDGAKDRAKRQLHRLHEQRMRLYPPQRQKEQGRKRGEAE